MLPIEPAWTRSDEDKRSWPVRRCREVVRSERRENGVNSKRGRGGVGDQEGNMSTRGDLGWQERGKSCWAHTLYLPAGVRQRGFHKLNEKQKQTNQQSHELNLVGIVCGMRKADPSIPTVATFAESLHQSLQSIDSQYGDTGGA